jgi:L-amino acid N-acyltransferase YncA
MNGRHTAGHRRGGDGDPYADGMADVLVRPAVAADAPEIARIQLSTWTTAYATVLPARVLAQLTEAGLAVRWTAAAAAPPSAAHHVLVAFEQDRPVGFVVVAPAEPDDLATADDRPPAHDPATTVAVGPLLVEPRWGRRGHGSRLLAAAVDLARADGARTAVSWVLERDTASRAFLASAGWAGDGTARDLDMAGAVVREVRLHTDLTAEPEGADPGNAAPDGADPRNAE